MLLRMAKLTSWGILFLLGAVLGCVAGGAPEGAAQGLPEVAPEAAPQAAAAPGTATVARVSEREARGLLLRFAGEAPATRAQRFGRPVLEELLADGASPSLELLFGLDAADGREHLVLRAEGSDQSFDRGGLCPPACPTSVDPEASIAAAGAGMRISAALAEALTEAYRAAHPVERAGVCLARAELQRLLADPAVSGVWFFHGRRATGERVLVLTAAGGDASARLARSEHEDAADAAANEAANEAADATADEAAAFVVAGAPCASAALPGGR